MTRATDEQLILVRAYADSIRMRDTAAALKAVLAELEELRQAVPALQSLIEDRDRKIRDCSNALRAHWAASVGAKI